MESHTVRTANKSLIYKCPKYLGRNDEGDSGTNWWLGRQNSKIITSKRKDKSCPKSERRTRVSEAAPENKKWTSDTGTASTWPWKTFWFRRSGSPRSLGGATQRPSGLGQLSFSNFWTEGKVTQQWREQCWRIRVHAEALSSLGIFERPKEFQCPTMMPLTNVTLDLEGGRQQGQELCD